MYALHCNQGHSTVDVDPYHKDWNEKSQKIFEFLEANCKVKQKTMNGGFHYIVRGILPNSTSELAHGIDTKGPGGYIIIYENFFTNMKFESIKEFLQILPCADEIVGKLGYKVVKYKLDREIKYKFVDNKNNKQLTIVKNNFEDRGRDNKYYLKMMRCAESGDREGLELAKNEALKEGLPKEQVEYKYEYYNKKMGFPVTGLDIQEPAKPTIEQATTKNFKFDNNNDKISKTNQTYRRPKMSIKEVKETIYQSYLLPKGEVVVLGGMSGIGKTRGMLSHVSKYQNLKILHVNSENPIDKVLNPLVHHLKMEDRYSIVEPKKLKPEGKTIEELIQSHKEHLTMAILEAPTDIVFFDPALRFLDWNNENSTKLIEAYQEIARAFDLTIILARNDGKNKEISDEHKPKGNASAFTDTPRSIIRTLKCEQNSKLYNECEGEAIVMYNTKNSLDFARGILFKKVVDTGLFKEVAPNGINVAWFDKKRELTPNEINKINILCGVIKAKTQQQQIENLLAENPDGVGNSQFYKSIDGKPHSIRSMAYKMRRDNKIKYENKKWQLAFNPSRD